MLSKKQQIVKRIFDIVLCLVGAVIILIPILILILVATISTRKFGLFSQLRVGQYSKIFCIYKIRTMQDHSNDNFITIKDDQRITRVGKFLRHYKLDELPQLFNVLIGNMSLVGPRPDVLGYADKLEGKNRSILSVKPGITGPATLVFRDEETLLAKHKDPLSYNNEVIWPQKIQLNRQYVENWSLKKDINYILQTIFN